MFLTKEDPRAQVKGSRDPLGVQALWGEFGRHLIGNLTTVTTSIRNFTVLLLGRYFVERLVEEERISQEDALAAFLQWEQVAGYARHLVHDAGGDVRGIDRIRRNVAEGEGAVSIGVGADEIILSDQKTYGLWGLYTVAARVSGLLPIGLIGVTPVAREFLEETCLPALGKQESPLLDLVESGGELSTRKNDRLLVAVGRALDPALSEQERQFYGHWLRDGAKVEGAVPGRQARLSALMASELDLEEWIGREAVLLLTEKASEKDEGLAQRLHKIAVLEAVLAPAQALFDHMLARRNQSLEALGRQIRKHWGPEIPNLDPGAYRENLPEIRDVSGPELAAVITDAHDALQRGRYADVLRLLTDWNRFVMERRGGAPWVVIDQGRLDVRYGGPELVLPARDELPTLWRNPYFLESLGLITLQLKEGVA